MKLIMHLVNTFKEFCKKDGKKIKPIFAGMLKTLHEFLHHAKNFIIFFAHLLKNQRKSRKLRKSSLNIFAF